MLSLYGLIRHGHHSEQRVHRVVMERVCSHERIHYGGGHMCTVGFGDVR